MALCLRNLPTMKPSPKPLSSLVNWGVHIWASAAGETMCLSPARPAAASTLTMRARSSAVVNRLPAGVVPRSKTGASSWTNPP